MALDPGARLGPYEILGALGAGGMGEVYKARDPRLDRTVAIKVLPSDVAGDPDVRARFEREARAIAALDHPHICGVYDVGSVDGTHYLVMPHVERERPFLEARPASGPRGLASDSMPPHRQRSSRPRFRPCSIRTGWTTCRRQTASAS